MQKDRVVTVGARGSKLSKKQVEEVLQALLALSKKVRFEPRWINTTGDKDLLSPLAPMDKTNFFTKEIDQVQLDGKCRISIHSAKDLPAPLPEGLEIVALTEGKSPLDVLVMRSGDRLETLKSGGVIGSSSARRDRAIRRLRPDLTCQEVRGPVEVRLEKLFASEIEGLVVAEAALIRLGLSHLNRIPLPGKSAPLQGKLAVIARKGDDEMKNLFSPIDTRKEGKSLYVGLSPKKGRHISHFPVIETVFRDFKSPEIVSAFDDLALYTHLIFTSKVGVEAFFACLKHYGQPNLSGKKVFAVGQGTAQKLEEYGVTASGIAREETQEGVIHMLALEDLDRAYILLPQSSRARSALAHSLMLRGVRHQVCHLYDTRPKAISEKPNLDIFEEIIFTSPSTVDAFIEIFGAIPKGKRVTAIGPITARKLRFSLDR